MKWSYAKSLKGLTLTMVLGLVLAGFVVPRQAEAIPVHAVSDGSNSQIILDNSDQDLAPEAGVVRFQFSSNNFSALLEISTKPYLGSAAHPQVHLSFASLGGRYHL